MTRVLTPPIASLDISLSPHLQLCFRASLILHCLVFMDFAALLLLVYGLGQQILVPD